MASQKTGESEIAKSFLQALIAGEAEIFDFWNSLLITCDALLSLSINEQNVWHHGVVSERFHEYLVEAQSVGNDFINRA